MTFGRPPPRFIKRSPKTKEKNGQGESTGYKSFEEAVHVIFGEIPKRRAAQRKVRAATITAVAKLLHKPATLRLAMRAMMAAK